MTSATAATMKAASVEHQPTRRCLVTGQTGERRGLVHFVVAPGGVLVPDIDEKLPGRGFWVTATRAAVETACRRKLFAKAARMSLRVSDDLPEHVEALLSRRCRDILGLAARAGQASFGYQKVREWLIAHKAGLLLEASDGGWSERGKLRALARDLEVIDVLTAEEMGAALGRGHFVHGVIAPGRLAERFAREAWRLAGFRTQSGPRPTDPNTREVT